MTETRPVIIVGAGPTGLTAAMELNRFKIPVRLVDRYKHPSDTSRALAVQARTMELFFQRGLSEEMVRLGNKGRGMTVYGRGKALAAIDFSHIDSRFNYILLLAQSETERILREQLARQSVDVECETEMVTFAQDGAQRENSGVRATLQKADGSLEEVSAAYMIDAEGAHSIVRHTLALPFEGKSLPHSYAIADLHVDGALSEDQLSVFLSERGLLAAFPMGNRRFRVFASEKADMAPDAPNPDLAYVRTLWQQGSHIHVNLFDMVWSSRFRINSRFLNQLHVQRIFFGGDSAHVHSPAGGQGMNTGIQDMINLAWKMALVYQGRAKPELLDTYAAERVPIIRRLVTVTETGTNTFDSDNPFVHSLVEHALPILLSFHAVQNEGAKFVTELLGNYRDSPLTMRHEGSGTLRAGDRAPDIKVGGQSPGDTLLSLLDPSRFTLYVVGNAAEPEGLPEWTNDWHRKHISAPPIPEDANSFRAALGDAKWLIVRPDGYLLWKAAKDHSGALKKWIAAWTV